jgi:hypothetical protein
MSERTFTLTLTAQERFTLLMGLGFLYVPIQHSPEICKPITDLMDRLTNTPGVDTPTASQSPAPMPVHNPTDYFARTQSGDVPTTPPKGAELKAVRILQAEEKPKGYLAVIFTGGKANCFDSHLWGAIKNRVNQDAQLWIAKSGNYLNVVGVRA